MTEQELDFLANKIADLVIEGLIKKQQGCESA